MAAPTPPRQQPTPRPHPSAGIAKSDLPDPRLTPGQVLTTQPSRVCVSGYAGSVRDVSEAKKAAVYSRYAVPHVPYAHEVDHLVSLELGGSNAMTNLWPEPYAGRWGATTKDRLENELHDLVCSGGLSLRHAQHVEATNWVSAYRRYVGAAPTHSPLPFPRPLVASRPPTPTRPSTRPSTRHGNHLATRSRCEPGYNPCLPRVPDLDCSQLPSTKTPVHVTGPDPYGLDADGDRIGCE